MRRSRRLAALICSLPAVRVLSPTSPTKSVFLRAFAMTDAGASPMWESMWSKGLKPKEAFDCGEASPTLTEVLSRKLLGCTQAGAHFFTSNAFLFQSQAS